MIHPAKGNLPNIALSNPAYGKIWWGDLLASEMPKVLELQNKLGVNLDVIEL